MVPADNDRNSTIVAYEDIPHRRTKATVVRAGRDDHYMKVGASVKLAIYKKSMYFI